MLELTDLATLLSDAQNADFADARLRARLVTTMAKLTTDPSQSFPKALTSAELEGAYRLFANPLVTPERILDGHFDRTRRACEAESTAIVVHDSSTFAFDPHGHREGLGRVRKTGQAFFAHVALVLSDERTRRPLGLAALSTWTRDDERSGGEKARWAQGVRQASERLGGAANVVHVMDREADDYALFADLVQGGHRFIIRVAHDRLLVEQTSADARKLSEAVARIEAAVGRPARLSKRLDAGRSPKQKKVHPSRGQRTAQLSVGSTPIVLKRPTTQSKSLPESLSLNIVRVWEPHPPDGEAPVEWLLVSNEPVDSTDALLRVVDRYCARWVIEEYFKSLKTGCAFPDRQLSDYEGLLNALALFAPIACRLLALRSQAQHAPEAPALRVLDEDEIEVLRVLGRTRLSESPSVREVMLAVAALGGHIKWSGEPGWLTLGRGLAELTTLTRGWRAAKLQRECDQR